MDRIFEVSDLTIDLGNIKNLRTEPFSSSSNGVYVIIELLNGKEYLQNPHTEELELFEPQIKEGFGSIERAEYFMKLIREEWSKYLKHRDEKPAHNHV
jgi:hypothetical protein